MLCITVYGPSAGITLGKLINFLTKHTLNLRNLWYIILLATLTITLKVKNDLTPGFLCNTDYCSKDYGDGHTHQHCQSNRH